MTTQEDPVDELIKDLFSKTAYDFRTPEGWEEFLTDRTRQKHRDDDGLQLADFTGYAVGAVPYYCTTGPAEVRFDITTQNPDQFPLPPGNVFIYAPDENQKFQVQSFYVGPPTKYQVKKINVGGLTKDGKPTWGTFYYVIIQPSDMPQKVVEKVADQATKKIRDEALKLAPKLIRRGIKLKNLGGGTFYVVYVHSGNQRYKTTMCNVDTESCLNQNALSKKSIAILNDIQSGLRRKIRNELPEKPNGHLEGAASDALRYGPFPPNF